jgi:hypothetical protein
MIGLIIFRIVAGGLVYPHPLTAQALRLIKWIKLEHDQVNSSTGMILEL